MITWEGVFTSAIEMQGTCDQCGKGWTATGTKQPGMNDSEDIVCPHCRKNTGDRMHCAFGPSVQRARRKRNG